MTDRSNRMRKWKSRRAWLVPVIAAVAIAAGIAATSGTGAAAGPVTITMWAHEGNPVAFDQTIKDAITAFNASQSGVVMQLHLIPEANYDTTVTSTPPSGLPDILEYDGPYMSSIAYAKKLQSVEGLVSTASVNDQTASVKAQNTYNGKLYGVSQFDAGLMLYGNKTLLKAAGVSYPTSPAKAWTANQFSAVLAKLAAKDKDGKVLDVKENYGAEWPTYGFLPIVASTGNLVVHNNKATGNLNNAKVIAAVEKFASWRKYIDPNTDDKAFVTKRVALSWVGPCVYPAYSQALRSNLVVMPLPNFGAGTKSGMGSWAWGISANSSHGAEAGQFLDFFLQDKWVSKMSVATGEPPATTSDFPKSTLYKRGGPLYLVTEENKLACGSNKPTRACVATPRPVTPAYPVISTQFSKAFWAAFHGGNANSLFAKAAKVIDTAYQDNNNYSG